MNLLVVPIQVDRDVAIARRQTKRIGVLLGLDPSAQTRLATAASEVARYVHAAGGGRLSFSLQLGAAPSLQMTVAAVAPLLGRTEALVAMAPAARLVDRLELETNAKGGHVLALTVDLPERAACDLDVGAIASTLAADGADATADDVREHNLELIAALEELRIKQDETARLATELAESRRQAIAVNRILQESLLPSALPQIKGVDIAAAYIPQGEGNEVGGDFYDCFASGDNEWTMLLGDVSGKGPRAAVVTALVRYTLRAVAVSTAAPADVLRTLNEAMLRQITDDSYCTILYLQIRPRPGGGLAITVAGGGHPPPLLIGRTAVRSVDVGGNPVGCFAEATFAQIELVVEDGEALVLYTDGITEARSPHGRFADDLLDDRLAALSGQPAQAVVDDITDAVTSFQRGRAQDDIAVLVLRSTTSPA